MAYKDKIARGMISSLATDYMNTKSNEYNIIEFGAIGDGSSHKLSERYNTLTDAQVVYPNATALTDEIDWAALQKALTLLQANDVLKTDVTLMINRVVTCAKKIKFNGVGTFKFTNDFALEDGGAGKTSLKMFHITADGVKFDPGLTFDNAHVGGNYNNVYIWNTRGKSYIQGCKFLNLPLAGNNFNGAIAFLAAAGAGTNVVTKCWFENCPGSVFTQQPNDIQCFNWSINASDVSYVTNSPNSKGCIIDGNRIYNNGTISAAGHIAAEQGASGWQFTNNTIRGIKNGYGIGAVSVGGDTNVGDVGVISGNIVDGLNYTSTSSQSAITIEKYYKNIKICDNIFKNIGAGHANNNIATFHVNDNEIYNNTFENTQGLPQTVVISCGTDMAGHLRIYSKNKFESTSNAVSAHVFFGTGDIPNSKVTISTSEFSTANEGINTANLVSIGDFILENNKYNDVTNPHNAANIIGTLLVANFNVIGKNYPHYISKNYKTVYANTVPAPTDGVSWTQKDIIWYNAVASGTHDRWLCISSGPGGGWSRAGQVGFRVIAGTPTGVIIPFTSYEEVFDESNSKWYKAIGSTNNTQWTPLT